MRQKSFVSSRPAHGSIFVIVILFAGISSFSFYSAALSKTNLNNYVTESYQATDSGAPPPPPKKKYQCLQSDGEIDSLIYRAEQIVITMPAKAAGSAMKLFAGACTGRTPEDNFLNVENEMKEELMMGPLSMPKIVASHIGEQGLMRLVERLPLSALLIYIHRQEHDRILSAIKHVFRRQRTAQMCDISYDEVNHTCIVSQKNLVSYIEKRTEEIGIGETQILTCNAYKTIQQNVPNMVFMHYKQADKLQRMLAKHHCPNYLKNEIDTHGRVVSRDGTIDTSIRDGDADQLGETRVRMNQDPVEDVDLKEWLKSKGAMLELALGLRERTACQGLTREMETDLFACGTESVHI